MKSQAFESSGEWGTFVAYVSHRNRFTPSQKSQEFLGKILTSAKSREKTLPKGEIFLRAKIGQEGHLTEPLPYSKDHMVAPPPTEAAGGRANPKGISYLYLSNMATTAISEVRPFLQQHVTVATFKLERDIKVIDASNDSFDIGLYIKEGKGEASSMDIENIIWNRINVAFSSPVMLGDKSIDYIPTQYLAEFFKNNSYDGIIYASSLHKGGFNMVLFYPTSAIPIGAQVYFVRKVEYRGEPIGDPLEYPYSS